MDLRQPREITDVYSLNRNRLPQVLMEVMGHISGDGAGYGERCRCSR